MDIRQLRGWLVRLFGLLHRKQREREFAEELEIHLAFHIEDNLRAGMSPEEARRQALIKLGGVTLTQERCREQGGLPMLETLGQDLRFGLRMLRKNPGFTAVAVLTLALGIGANTAIFSVVKTVLLATLPYHDADRLVMLWENDTLEGNAQNSVAPGNFVDWRKQNEFCTQLAYYAQPESINVTGNGEPERLVGIGVSANLFGLLGVQPMLGRGFLPIDMKANDGRELILSHGLWQRRYGSEAAVIGKTLTFDGVPWTIVGVMPPQFQLPEEAEMWWQTLNGELGFRNRYFLRAMGRLKQDVTIRQAQAGFTTIAQRLEQQYPDTNKGRGINVISFRDQFVGDVRLALLMLFGAVGFVLLIACVNVANLLLARAAARGQEMAVRAALGAGRWRLIRQLLTESLLLALAGGALGLLLVLWGVDLLVALSPTRILQARQIRIDGVILGFTFVMTLLTGFVCGLAPAWQATQTKLHEALKEGGRGAADSPRRRYLRSSLVVAEIALALVLLVGAGLLIRSFRELHAVDAGFDTRNLLTMQFSLTGLKYDDSTQRAAGYHQLMERLSVLPGVQSVAAVSRLPLAGDRSTSGMAIEGRATLPGEKPEVHSRVVTPGYFSVMDIPLQVGRAFTDRDVEGQPDVVVINETLARRYWPNENAVGKRIRLGPNDSAPWQTIVGVAGDARNFGLDTEARPEAYVAHSQNPAERMRVLIRTTTEPLSLMPAVRATVTAFDQDLPFSQVTTMEQLYAKSVAQRRLNMWLLTILAGVALLLSVFGIYGVMAYTVAQRTREIGVRMALGAQGNDVLKLILNQGMILTLSGVLLGLTASVALTRLMKTLLFGVSATDLLTFVVIALLLTVIALLACWIPARRATKVDPLIALRSE